MDGVTQESRRGPAPRRVLVVGSSGSGKTTTAAAVGARLGLPVLELDAVHWGPGWTAVPAEEMRRRVDAFLAAHPDGWVADGNYDGRLGDRLWRLADTVVFLDLGLPTLLARIARRTVARSLRGVELWSGNRERIAQLWSRESLLGFTARQYRHKRERWAVRSADPAYAGVCFVRLTSGRAVRRWVASLPEVPGP